MLKDGDLDSLFGLSDLRDSLQPDKSVSSQGQLVAASTASPCDSQQPLLASSLPCMLSSRQRTRDVSNAPSAEGEGQGSVSLAAREVGAAAAGACRVPSASTVTSLESMTTTCWVDSARCRDIVIAEKVANSSSV